ncbi:hypothetical protein VRU48_15545 [Pedobacter sp. KR3-3]|uniref:Uncharacterized protein n=1 Tax=Pedobacter albus TaxID=3113905 RepID=A0ABU7IBJ3_9SPHI|nr:hypothetical protein [Pedobacter sp. KR3-3]MEE1946539.1 hypothetical protein [Pedobacter sp. KR3-3]
MNTKLKQISIVAILLVVLVTNSVKSQQFKLQSLDGAKIEFRVSKNDQNILSIIYASDTVYVRDVKDIKSARVLGNRFLMINYGVRAGTGISSARTLLLSGYQKKLIKSLEVTSLFREDFLDFDNHVTSPMKAEVKSVYNVELSLLGNSIANYKLVVKIHDERTSMHAPKTDYNKNGVETLSFDKTDRVFYSLHEDISGYFTLWDSKMQKEIRKYVKGNFAIAKLGTYKYYYINGSWYFKSDNNELTKYAYN